MLNSADLESILRLDEYYVRSEFITLDIHEWEFNDLFSIKINYELLDGFYSELTMKNNNLVGFAALLTGSVVPVAFAQDVARDRLMEYLAIDTVNPPGNESRRVDFSPTFSMPRASRTRCQNPHRVVAISGRDKINVVPPTASAEMDCRILPEQNERLPLEGFVQGEQIMNCGTGIC